MSLWRKEKNQRVQVIRLAQHAAALGTARNEAAKAGSGKYLMFMDDDNYAKSNEVSNYHAGKRGVSSCTWR